MNSLKNKTFLLLTTIFTIFSLILIITYNATIYNREKANIKDELISISNTYQRFPSSIQTMKRPLFMNIEAYVVTFDSAGNISSINCYSDNDFDESEITKLAKNVNLEKLNNKISNLYFSKYIYSVSMNKNLIIINNINGRTYMLTALLVSLLLFCLFEIIIIYLSKYLTDWLVKPIEETFNKQKQFICDASHELKTPLAIIVASAETLEANPKEKKWLENIKEESSNMNKLVTNLLELAKTESNENKEYSETDLSKLVENKSLSFESIMFENKIELNLEIEKNINFRCDQDRIRELISILIDNAIKHSTEKSKITISLFKEKENINLIVKNKGEPIPKEEREKIFERFYRIDKSRNRETNRYGLGLSIAKNIVNNHNGEISVDCNHGYTTFKVTFKQK